MENTAARKNWSLIAGLTAGVVCGCLSSAQATEFAEARQAYIKRKVVCTTTNVARITHGIIVKEDIDLNGQNVRVDSFDSSDVNASTLGKYDPAKARDNGDVATSSCLTDSVQIGNANIFGKVSTGPGGLVSIGSRGMVGSTTWQSDPANQGEIQPGWSDDDMNFDFKPIQLPFTTGLQPLRNILSLDGLLYDMVLSSGNFYLGPGNRSPGKST